MIPRKEVTVSLGEGQHTQEVVVREITPGMSLLLAKAVMGDLEEETAADGAEQECARTRQRHVLAYLLGDVESRLRLLEACTSVQEQVRDLGGGDYLRLWQAFEEVNEDFFALLARRLAQTTRAAGGKTSETRPQSGNAA